MNSGARGDGLRILVVQDHPLLASAIARILETELDLSVRGIVRTGAEAAAVALREQVAVVLMDFNQPDMSGPGAAVSIRSAMPDVAIVFHSAEESETALLDAIDAGATAFLTKAATPLAAEFTARELDVLRLLAEGLNTNVISQRLGIAVHTTEWRVRHVIENWERSVHRRCNKGLWWSPKRLFSAAGGQSL